MTMSLATLTDERDVVLEMWAESIIEMHRFSCDEDRILARWDEDDVDALMPSSDDLAAIGFDIVGLAKALEAGLSAEMFGKAYPLLDVAEFNIALVSRGAGLDIALFNEGMEHLADMAAECA